MYGSIHNRWSQDLPPSFRDATEWGQDTLRRDMNLAAITGKLSQDEVDAVLHNLVDYKNPLRTNILRRRGSGEAWLLNRRTPGTTAAAFINDTEDLSEDVGTYARVSFTYRTLAIRCKVSRVSQLVSASYIDAVAEELEAKMDDFKDKEDWAFLWGQNGSTPIATLEDAKSYDGLNALCPSATIIQATSASAGEAMTLADIDLLLDTVRTQSADMLVMNLAARRQLNSLLQAQQRFNNVVKVQGGFELMAYNNVPIFPSSNIPSTCTFDGTDTSALTGGSTTVIFAIDSSKVFMPELEPLHMEPLAKKSSQYDEYDLRITSTLAIRDANAVASLHGVLIS